MNRELHRLLAEAGCRQATAPGAWQRTIVLNNFGSVPLAPNVAHDFAAKGFKLLLLDARGRPTHFARCGAASDRALERESAMLDRLTRSPDLATILPATRSASSAVIRVQVSAYIPGRNYQRFVRGQNPEEWSTSVTAILDARWRISVQAALLFPDLVRGGPLVNLLDEAAPRMQRLRQAGVEAHYLAAIDAALGSVGSLPRVLQHGDLWPSNVIHYNGSWWLIDFAEFGQVQVPLYDAFHLLESNPGRQHLRTKHAWLTLGTGAIEDIWTRAGRAVLDRAAARSGIGPREAGAALVYYLVHLSAYRLRAGVPREFGEAYLRELRRVAELLHRGLPLENLVVS